jgi:RHS repeat-associated protein
LGAGRIQASGDEQYYFVYDHRWRAVATLKDKGNGTTATLVEAFVYHAAGVGGRGGSSYIDSVVMRDATNNFGWTAEGDDTLPLRTFYVQNWRADVVAVLDSIGQPIEELRYTAYGTPSVHPMADVNHDGLVNATDVSVWGLIKGGNAPTGVWSNDDLNRDELFPTDAGDDDFFFDRHASSAGGSYGFHHLSSIGNRLGYAGYVWDTTSRVWHVRHRVLESESGKWTRMDPLGYVDEGSLYEYVQSQVVMFQDPFGLTPWSCLGCLACLGSVSASCSILCTNDHWDTPGEGFWSCFFKCIEATPDAAPLLTAACAGVCSTCIGKLKLPRRNPSPQPSNPNPNPRVRPRNSGDCTAAEHAALEAAKLAACNGAKHCRPNDTCETILLNIARLEACVLARRTIMRRCFRGGDERHENEVRRQERGLADCIFDAREKRCFGGVAEH